jgi:anaerobic ribonucleoside-triphosphate reductase activating protein
MGGNLKEINSLAEYVKNIDPPLKVGWYTGGIIKENELPKLKFFDYVKSGPYIKELGGLDCPSTNQKFYEIIHLENKTEWLNLTYKFWKHGNEK